CSDVRMIKLVNSSRRLISYGAAAEPDGKDMSQYDDFAPEVDADEPTWHRRRAFKLARDLARASLLKHRLLGPPLNVDAMVELEGLRLIRIDEDTNTAGVLFHKSREI